MTNNNNKNNKSNFKKPYNNKGKAPMKRKVRYVNKTVKLGSSDFYNFNLSDLLNILDSVPFDKISVPVSMGRGILNGDDSTGFSTVGNIQKFNGTEMVISVTEAAAEKITDEVVAIARCKKNRETGEITYVSAIYLDKGTPVEEDDFGFEEENETETSDTEAEEVATDDVADETPVEQ